MFKKFKKYCVTKFKKYCVKKFKKYCVKKFKKYCVKNSKHIVLKNAKNCVKNISVKELKTDFLVKKISGTKCKKSVLKFFSVKKFSQKINSALFYITKMYAKNAIICLTYKISSRVRQFHFLRRKKEAVLFLKNI